jgi:glucose-1-phosphate thymidylyltransferase
VILQTNRTLLRNASTAISDAMRHSNIIVPPVYISPLAKIENSIIGPDVSVGDHAIISRSIVKNSIIGQNAELESAILENSLIGSDSTLIGAVHSLNIGDSAEINLRNY